MLGYDLDELERLVEGDNAPFVTALLLYAPAILHDLKVLKNLRSEFGSISEIRQELATLRELGSPEMQEYADLASQNDWGHDLVKQVLQEAKRRVTELESGPAKRDEPELSETRGE